MFLNVQQIQKSCNLPAQVRLDALEKALPLAAIEQALRDTHTSAKRERKLNCTVTMLLVIAMNLFVNDGIGYVLQRLCKGMRLLRFLQQNTRKSTRKSRATTSAKVPEDRVCGTGIQKSNKIPGDSALVYRRYQLGARPLHALFRTLCRPLARDAATTPKAFLFGLRLMGIDGQIMTVPDTAENTAYFGKMQSGNGQSSFPKVQGVYLCELGTHAIVDAGFWPCRFSEEALAYRLLRSVEAGMLVMYDRGLWAAERVIAIRSRGAHVLCRIPSTLKPVLERVLPDGTHLVWVSPGSSRKPEHAANRGTKDQERLLVRLVRYTIDDPSIPGYGEKYRLITTLLDPDLYPAREIAVAYHKRWEVEMAFDEIESHQCVCTQDHHHLHGGPLRSQKPVGVLQELYGLLIAHWAVRNLMGQAAEQAGLEPTNLSFVNSLRLIRDAVHDFQTTKPSVWPALHQMLLDDIARNVLPPRRPRSNPRVVKRQQSRFPVKREKHRPIPNLTKSFEHAIVLI